MATMNDRTTLVCLFHHQNQAQAAISDLLHAGVSQESITVIGDSGTQGERFAGSSLGELGVPERDQQHLLDGVRNGGSIVAVRAMSDRVDAVEDIFENHKAKKIDEAEDDDYRPEALGNGALGGAALTGAAMPARGTAEGERSIPVVEEELVVGKRTVDQGGVRVYRRVIEVPVEESVNLRQEHVDVQRRAVDRPVTDADRTFAGDRTIELTETAEEAVIAKSARVVEEVHVGKSATERTEHIHDTVRKTEVEVEEIAPTAPRVDRR